MPFATDWLIAGIRRVGRVARHGPDRLLHGWRRQRAARAIVRRAPRSVLFVCFGNICRSPYAAAMFRRLLENDETNVYSAGFAAGGRQVPDTGLEVARRRGHELTAHRSQQLTAESIAAADLVIVMSGAQRRWLKRRYRRDSDVALLGDFDPSPIDTRTVQDPVDRPAAVYEQVYDRIDRCLTELLQLLRSAEALANQEFPASSVGAGSSSRRPATEPNTPPESAATN